MPGTSIRQLATSAERPNPLVAKTGHFSAASFDDLGGAGEERLRDSDTERLRGFQVDD